MRYKFNLFDKKKKFFKNNELTYRIFFSIARSLKNENNGIISKKFYYDFLTKQKWAGCFKGYSIHNYKRKGYYSKFQLTRFDIKKLASYKLLTGVKAFYW